VASGTATSEDEATFLKYLEQYDFVYNATVAMWEQYLTSPSAWERAHGWKLTPQMLITLQRAKARRPNDSSAHHGEGARSVTRPGQAGGRERSLVPREHRREAMLSPVAASQRVEFAEVAFMFDLLSPAHSPTEFSARVAATLATRARLTLTAGSEAQSRYRSALAKLGFDIDLTVLASFENPCFSSEQGHRRGHLLRQIEYANEETHRQLLLLASPNRPEVFAGGRGLNGDPLSFSRSLLVYGEFLRQQSRQTFEGLRDRMPPELPRLLSDVAAYGRAGNTPAENDVLLQRIYQDTATARKEINFLLDICGPRTVISWGRRQLITRQRSVEVSFPRRRPSPPLQDDIIDRIAAGSGTMNDDSNFCSQIYASLAFHRQVRERLRYYSQVAPLKFERLRALCEDLDPLYLRLTQSSEARMELRYYISDLNFQERCFRRRCEQQLNLPSRYRPAVSQRESSADTQPSTRRGRPQPAAQSQVGATTAAEALSGLSLSGEATG
jgi:hypothetical protein